MLVLASGSAIRRQLLDAAGIRFEVDPSRVDEPAFLEEDPERRARGLAVAKASEVSARRPGALVLGSDQVFTLDGEVNPKPTTEDELRFQLTRMSGRTHRFRCGLALVRDAETVFVAVDEAQVTFRVLDEAEISWAVATREGIGCAGGYRLEEGGVALIERVSGSHFTVLGLPMIPLIGALRDLGLVPAIYRDRVAP